jgi:DNA-binding protein HU-beta
MSNPTNGRSPARRTSPDINYRRLVELVSWESGIDPETVAQVLRATFDVIGRAVTSGGTVSITNFGTWKVREVGPRRARNPHTGETVQVPARQRPAFSWSDTIKVALAHDVILDTLVKNRKGTGTTVDTIREIAG